MNDRNHRAQHLGEQLKEAMAALAEATRGTDAALFLDRLARLDGYSVDEVAAVADLPGLIDEARAARAEHRTELGAAAGQALDVERFLEVGRHLAGDASVGARDGWLRDLLLVATVLPWLPPARQLLARGAIAKATALVEAEPEAFLDAAVLAQDRRALEDPSALGADAQAVLALLEELPLLVVFDRAPTAAGWSLLEDTLTAVGRALLDDAEDALHDHQLRRNPKLAPRTERLSLAAADETQFPLCRTEAGVWVLLRRAGEARLRWGPDGTETDASVEVLTGARAGLLTRNSVGDFVLPDTQERLSLRLRVGPDSRGVDLDPSEG